MAAAPEVEKCVLCNTQDMPLIRVPCKGESRLYHNECYGTYTEEVIKMEFSRSGKAYYILYHNKDPIMKFSELQKRFTAMTGARRALNKKELMRSWGDIFSIVTGDHIAIQERVSKPAKRALETGGDEPAAKRSKTDPLSTQLVAMGIPQDDAKDIEQTLGVKSIDIGILNLFSFDKLVGMGIKDGHAMRIVQFYKDCE